MLSVAIEMREGGRLGEKTVSFNGGLRRRGAPFDFAQGRLSTAFGWRLTSLRMTATLSDKISVRWLVRASTVRYSLLYGWMLEAG